MTRCDAADAFCERIAAGPRSLLFAVSYFLGERALRERHVPVPRQEHCLPLVPEKTRIDSRYLKRPLPKEPQTTVPKSEQLQLFVPSLRRLGRPGGRGPRRWC